MTRLALPGRVWLALSAVAASGLLALVLVFPNQMMLSRMFEADGQLRVAAHYSDAWSRAHPQDRESRWHTAELRLRTDDPAGAVRILEAMARDWPDDARILEPLVEIEDSLLRVDSVVPRLEALVAVRPDDPVVLGRLADHHRWFGDTEKLLATLRRIVTLGDYPDERTEFVEILLSHRRYQELIEFFSRGIEKMPNQVDARLALAQAYLRTGRLDQAIAELYLVLELEPARIEHMRDLAGTLVEVGRFAEAAALYRARIDADPRNAALVAELADVYETAADRLASGGRLDEAIVQYRQRVALDPTNVQLRVELADMHGQDTHKVAVAELRDLLALEPRSIAGWAALAERLSWSGDPTGASAAWSRCVELAPADLGHRRQLAQHLLWSGDERRAIDEYEQVVELGGSVQDRAVLVELLLDAEQPEQAFRQARILITAAPSPRNRRLFAFAATLADHCDVAIDELRRLAAATNDDEEVWYNLSQCATRLGHANEALEALRNVKRIRGGDHARPRTGEQP